MFRQLTSNYLAIEKEIAGMKQSMRDLGLRGITVLKDEGPWKSWYKLMYLVKNRLDYAAWVRKNEPTAVQLQKYREQAAHFGYRPKISIIMPVYNPAASWVSAAIESVKRQAYENWELCIADASTGEEIKGLLRHYAESGPGIKVRFLDENHGIAGNTNEALLLASGEYVGLLDHDDEISPDALYEVVKYLQAHRDADIIYSDEDKIGPGGRRSDPFFKPGWSPDMLLSCMYTGHLSIYRRRLVEDIGGFRQGYDGSQDYDLALRLIERTKSIHHIPKVLYHWRMVPGSTSVSIGSKRYAYDAAKKALSDHLARNGIKGEVLDGLWQGSYHVKREISGTPLVSIIIPARDTGRALKKCLDSIVNKTGYQNYEILVVDNNGLDKKTLDHIEEIKGKKDIRVLSYGDGFNFSAINNYAAGRSNGEMLLFLNDDTEVIAGDWLGALAEHAQRKEVGAVGCKLLYPDDTVRHAGIILGIKDKVAGHAPQLSPHGHHGYVGRESLILNLSAVTAACMMMRRDVFEEAGGFDEGLALAYNDVDLCLRVRQKGYLIVYTPYAVLYHHGSMSRGYDDTEKKRALAANEILFMRERWGDIIDAGDPYYNPNLTLDSGDFSLRL